jgi:hypothetical protein
MNRWPAPKQLLIFPKQLLIFAIAFLAVTGCATRLGTAGEPAAAVPSPVTMPSGLPGTWTGVMTGRELGTTGGVSELHPRFTIRPDGTWSLKSDGGDATGRVLTTGRGVIVLDGRFTGSGKAPAGTPVRYVLVIRGPGGLVGSADDYFPLYGHEVHGEAYLHKVG